MGDDNKLVAIALFEVTTIEKNATIASLLLSSFSLQAKRRINWATTISLLSLPCS
jgi:hypothetical protein